MGNQSKTKDNFLAQAGILAAAGILSRIIGLLYKSPLVAVIGKTGFGYYHAAYGFYTIVLLVSSYSIPSAISKLIAPKLAVREYRNAHRLFYCALGYVLVVGMIAGLFLFFCAGWFVEEQAVPVLRMFAPTIFFYGILGVLRGYFQAHRSMVQTSFSQILEQIANAVVSIGGAWLLIKMGTAGVTAGTDMEGKRAVLGAMGSALGTGMGVLAGLIFMWGVYLLNRRMILKRVQRDAHENIDSYGRMIRMISLIVTPFILSTAIYNLNSTVVSYLYTKLIPNLRALDSDLQYANYGTYGVAVTVFNIPIAFATAMASAMIPSVAQASASGDIEKTKEKITSAVKATMIISIPAAVGLFALAKPIIYILFPSSDEDDVTLAAKLLMVLAAAVVLYALSTLSNSILQGLGRVNIPVVNAGIALTIQSIASFLLLMYTNVDLYGLAITNTLYAAIMCVLNQVALRRVIHYRQEWKKSFVLPSLASLVMGVSAKGAYQLLVMATKSPRIALVPAVAFGVVVYFVVLLSLKALSEEELKDLPKGHVLVKIAKKCKLL
ncbi:MAG: polysaccharide biosynthesis protein [Lachnospiraceae bacterium]|nr:polysaccharide biosynthesis protein [Lachnospiraceae bacterium]MBR3510233.1 polysaccharide biosynthesis protein [Lachnospiraceae bacterium]